MRVNKLTADLGRGPEGCGYIGVEIYREVVVTC